MATRKSDDMDDGDVVGPVRRAHAPELGPGEPEESRPVAGITGEGKASDVPANSRFSDRVKAREASEKRVASAQNKAVDATDAK